MTELGDTLIRYDEFDSNFVTARTVDVWLPPSYEPNGEKRFPVLYMHDGQNLFDSTHAFGGVCWGVDTAVTKLSASGKIPEMIIVGVWNTFYRFTEYMPDRPFRMLNSHIQGILADEYEGEPQSDNYLKFLVSELKPYIDKHYRTLPNAAHTLIMGSSMGGLISAYALCEYPEVFGKAGCMSTHWIGSVAGNMEEVSDAMATYMTQKLPPPLNHRLYFDFGTINLDALYEPHQLKIDAVMKQRGYTYGLNWVTRKFVGADHSERDWRNRLHVPLLFLARNMV